MFTRIFMAVGAVTLIYGEGQPANAEKIQASECRVITGSEFLSTIYNWPDFTLSRPGRAFLACPFKESMTRYDVLYYDQDGKQSNQSLSSWVTQTVYYNPGTLDNHSPDTSGCDFQSNFTTGNPIGPATVPCRIKVGPNTFQSFIIELWAKNKQPDVRFIGIITHNR